MNSTYDLVVVGAGPAGMAACIQARQHGLCVLLLDEQDGVGGQIYRGLDNLSVTGPWVDGDTLLAGQTLVAAWRDCDCDYHGGASVWNITPAGEIAYTRNGEARMVQAQAIILATGAMERPFPIKGWTLPGVMTVGGAQILLKTEGLAANHAVFAGMGPLLYLTAYQYVQAGVKVQAVLDTTPNYGRQPWLAVRGLVGGAGDLFDGIHMLKALRRNGVQHITRVESLELIGKDTVSGLAYHCRGRWQQLQTEHVFLHQGVVPNTSLAMAGGCEHKWDASQLCWRPETDSWGATSVKSIYLAGDGCRIAGARAAPSQGALAALQVACQLQRISPEQRDAEAAVWRKDLRRATALRPWLDTVFQPPRSYRLPASDATLVCRCEEVTAGEVKAALAMGCPGPNQVKSFTRCGMGPCQGRQCSLTLTEMTAQALQTSPDAVGHLRLRMPVKPLTFQALANLTEAAEENEAGCEHL